MSNYIQILINENEKRDKQTDVFPLFPELRAWLHSTYYACGNIQSEQRFSTFPDSRGSKTAERRAGLSNAAPVICFPGALFYSAGFNVNQNFKEKIFLNNSMFRFFRSTPMNTVFPLLKSCYLLYPFYCPLTPPFPFSH
jgi:hypothetical protein